MMADGMRGNVKAGAIMLLAVGAFSFMHAGMKTLSSAYPPLQIAALRCLASLPLILVWVGVRGGFRQVLRVRFGLHALRAAIGIVMLATFVSACGGCRSPRRTRSSSSRRCSSPSSPR
jgi:membrane protease YdiL (CAAX protease family)